MSELAASDNIPLAREVRPKGPLIKKQSAWTRLTHWFWAVALFFLLLSGLGIFNAHPTLYLGRQSGFGFSNEVLHLGAENTPSGPVGFARIFGHRVSTTGVLGMSYENGQPVAKGFPAWATVPSYYDLGTARVIHFFFAWTLVFTLPVWLVASLLNGHLRRDLVPTGSGLKRLPEDIVEHAKLRFHHTRNYNTLQKLSYAAVLFILLPLMILTGLAMSPSFNAVVPFLNDLLGGRQTARTIHFTVMVLLVLFFIVHIVMVVAAGPFNELRSIVTGWYRTDPPADPTEGRH